MSGLLESIVIGGPEAEANVPHPVASLEAGNYTLAVDVLYDNYPFGYDTLHLGVVPFAVGGSPRPAEPVPSMDGAAALLLGVLLAFVARRAPSGSAKRRRMLV